MQRLLDRNAWVATGLFLLALFVYAATTSPSIAFWDCGEFTATAYRLGIPHQPGTPLYVLAGRVFSLLPLGFAVAKKINLMSSFFGALAVMFSYLAGVRLQRSWAEEREQPSPTWVVRLGAAIGACFLAFSFTFWDNAIEAEVYAMAAFTLAITSYLALRWYDVREKDSSHTLMLLIVYIMGLSIGFHLGSILVFPGVVVLVVLADRKALRSIDLWIVSAFMTAFVVSTLGSHPVLVGTTWLLGLGSLSLAVGRMVRRRGFALAGIGLFTLGLSTHLFMLIRAHHDPMINETDPTSFQTLLSVLRREQYPPRSMFVREAPLWWQFGQFWGSVLWKANQMAGQRVIGYLQQFTFMPRHGFLDSFLPLALWLYGLWCQARGHARLFTSIFTNLLVNSVGLILFLNFTSEEVRDRDYFFFGAYQFLAMFIGLGAGGLLRLLWLVLRGRALQRLLTIAVGTLLLILPLLPVLMARAHHPKWFEHDRSHDVIARNYGYNMLMGLPQDAILFTNGDNDTFPLWYLQEVEHFRTDVRVVNLSLVNLPWYILQLRDYAPKVPIAWSDDQINGTATITHRDFEHAFQTYLLAQRLPDNKVLYVRDMAVWHILRTNLAGPKRAIYFAVTIPDDAIADFLPYLRMEGLVYRFDHTHKNEEKPPAPAVDSEAIVHNLTQVYDLRSVLNAQGETDTTVYRDSNTAHLLRNYPAALCRAAYEEVGKQDYAEAATALEAAYHMDPGFQVVVEMLPLVYLQLHNTAKVVQVGERYLSTLTDGRALDQLAFDIGDGLAALGEKDLALDWARKVQQRLPDDSISAQLLFRVHRARGEDDEAERVLAKWVARTGNRDAAAELERFRAMRAGGAAGDSALLLPAMPPAGAPGTTPGGAPGGTP